MRMASNLPSNWDWKIEADAVVSTDLDIRPGFAFDLQIDLHVGEVSVKSVGRSHHIRFVPQTAITFDLFAPGEQELVFRGVEVLLVTRWKVRRSDSVVELSFFEECPSYAVDGIVAQEHLLEPWFREISYLNPKPPGLLTTHLNILSVEDVRHDYRRFERRLSRWANSERIERAHCRDGEVTSSRYCGLTMTLSSVKIVKEHKSLPAR